MLCPKFIFSGLVAMSFFLATSNTLALKNCPIDPVYKTKVGTDKNGKEVLYYQALFNGAGFMCGDCFNAHKEDCELESVANEVATGKCTKDGKCQGKWKHKNADKDKIDRKNRVQCSVDTEAKNKQVKWVYWKLLTVKSKTASFATWQFENGGVACSACAGKLNSFMSPNQKCTVQLSTGATPVFGICKNDVCKHEYNITGSMNIFGDVYK